MSWDKSRVNDWESSLKVPAEPASKSSTAVTWRYQEERYLLDLFFVTPDGAIQWRGRVGNESRGGYQIASPGSASVEGGIASVSRTNNHVEVWWIGPKGSVESAHLIEGAVWWKKHTLAEPGSAALASPVAALSIAESKMEVWWIGPSGRVEGSAYDTPTSKWTPYQLTAEHKANYASGLVLTSSDLPRAPGTDESSPLRTIQHLFWVTPTGTVESVYRITGLKDKWTPLSIPDSQATSSRYSICAINTEDHRRVSLFCVWPDGTIAEHRGQLLLEFMDKNTYRMDWTRPILSSAKLAHPHGSITGVARERGVYDIFWITPARGIDGIHVSKDDLRSKYSYSGPATVTASGCMLAKKHKEDFHTYLWAISSEGVYGTLLMGEVKPPLTVR